MAIDHLKAMRLFVLTVQKGSLSAAASAEGLSPTMVGNYLKSLEAHLGMSLLNRTTRRQNLTEFGERYLARCLDILERVDAADALASSARAQPRGTLRFTAPLAFGVDELMPAIADYAAAHPEVHLAISISDLVSDLIADGFDAAIRIGRLEDSELIARPLRTQPLVCCASPAYLAAKGTPQRPADLARHQCLEYRHAARSEWRFHHRAWPMRDAGKSLVVPIGGQHSADNAPALRRMALAGMGIVLLPRAMLADDIAEKRLVTLLESHMPNDRSMHVVYRRDAHASPKLMSFIDFMVDRFGIRGLR